jgi:hypothetical protein
MNQQLHIEDKKGSLKNLTLIIASFVSIFYPRLLDSIGFPSTINFVHFIIVPFTFGVAIFTTTVKNKKQINITWEIAVGCLLFFGVNVGSALLNRAGVINVFLQFVLLTEPYMLLLAIICLPLSQAHLVKLRAWFLISAAINVVLAIAQYFLMTARILPVYSMSLPDNVQGVFYLTGAGNYVSASISIAAALYYFLDAKKVTVGFRVFWLLAAFYQLLISDSKQILIVFAIAWALLVLTKFDKVDKFLFYVVAFTLFLTAFFWAVENLDFEALSAFKYWFGRTELYGTDGEAVNAKMAGANIIISYFKSPLNWWFGLGPGHTIGRVGGWILRDYAPLLAPLSPTIHPATQEIWNALNSNWLVLESSMFAPIFSWVGLWGDLGFLGLGAYFFLAAVTWRRLCKDDLSKLLMLTMLVYGCIFTQVEEPGQSLTVALMIGLQWHQRQNRRLAHLIDSALSVDFEVQPRITSTPLYVKPLKRR